MTDKREQIEAAATKAIQKDGVRSVSFRTLADEVGVKSASVHYHFPTKSDLTHAVVCGYTERFRDRLAEIDRAQDTLAGKLDAFIRIFEDVLSNSDLCLCGMMASEMTSLDPGTRQGLRRFFAESEGWLEQTFEQHQAELSSDYSAAQLARLLMAGLEGALLLDRVCGNRDRIGAFRAFSKRLVG